MPPGPVEEPIPSAAALERMCSAKGAMQFAFGQTGVPLSSRMEADFGKGFRAPAVLAPFTRVQPRSTPWSGQLMEMTYSVPIPNGQEARVQSLQDRIGERLAAADWMFLEFDEDGPPVYLIGLDSGNTFFRRTGEGAEASRVLIALDYQLGELTLTCAHDGLLLQGANEAFGKLPAGTPRPLVPEIALPSVRSEADCTAPETLEEVKRIFAAGKPDRFMADMVARTSYRDRLTTWMMWKLDDSGKITPERLIELSFSAIGGASPGGNPFAALEMITDLPPILKGMEAAEKTGDAAAMCRSLIPLQQLLAKADAITLKQTQATQSALTAEAKRLGVSFD